MSRSNAHEALLKRSDDLLWPRRYAIASFLLMLVIQTVLCFIYSATPQLSDYHVYITYAQQCYAAGSWYPLPEHLYHSYIFAPGLVNYLVLQLNLFGTLSWNMPLNMLLNAGIIYMIYTFARQWFNDRTALWSVTLYCLLYSTWWCVVPAGTEVPFLFLSLLGIRLMLDGKLWQAVVAGLCLALANWIRPLALIYLLFAIVIWWTARRPALSATVLHIIALAAGYILAVALTGMMSRSINGEWITKSSTGGINLAYTANDKAYGGVASTLTADSTNLCFIADRETLTYAEKDSVWRTRAMDWIAANPGRYAKLYAMKWGGIFVEDAWPDRAVLKGSGMVDAYAHGQIPLSKFLPHAVMLVSKSAVYYIVVLLFIVSLVYCRRDIMTSRGLWLALWAAGIGATCIFAVSPRYHYPFLFVMVMWGAYGLTGFLDARRARKGSRESAGGR